MPSHSNPFVLLPKNNNQLARHNAPNVDDPSTAPEPAPSQPQLPDACKTPNQSCIPNYTQRRRKLEQDFQQMLDRTASKDPVMSDEQFSKFELQMLEIRHFMLRPYNALKLEATKNRRKKAAAKKVQSQLAAPTPEPKSEPKPKSQPESEPLSKGTNFKRKAAEIDHELEAEPREQSLPKRQKKDTTEAREKPTTRPPANAQAQKRAAPVGKSDDSDSEDDSSISQFPSSRNERYVLLLLRQEDPHKPLGKPNQPPYIRMSESKLRKYGSTLYGLCAANHQPNWHYRYNDDDTYFYDVGQTDKPKKFIRDKIIYVHAVLMSEALNPEEENEKSPNARDMSKNMFWHLLKRWANWIESGKSGRARSFDSPLRDGERHALQLLADFLGCDDREWVRCLRCS